MPAPAVVYAVAAPVVAFALYRRLRRNFGRQRLGTGRLSMRLALLSLLALLVLFFGLSPLGVSSSAHALQAAAASVGGLVGGAALGWHGLGLTRFESTPEGRFYTPNRTIGLALAALVVARLAYRLAVLAPLAGAAGAGGADMAAYQKSPLTLAILALMVGYHLAYSVGLYRHARRGDMAPTS